MSLLKNLLAVAALGGAFGDEEAVKARKYLEGTEESRGETVHITRNIFQQVEPLDTKKGGWQSEWQKVGYVYVGNLPNYRMYPTPYVLLWRHKTSNKLAQTPGWRPELAKGDLAVFAVDATLEQVFIK